MVSLMGDGELGLVFNRLKLHPGVCWPIQHKKRQIMIRREVVPSNRKLGKWNGTLRPPFSLFFFLAYQCKILAAEDLHSRVKDERSCLPWVKYRLLSSFVPFTLLLRPLAACLFGWKTWLLFFMIPFLPSIKISLEMKHGFMLCQAPVHDRHKCKYTQLIVIYHL